MRRRPCISTLLNLLKLFKLYALVLILLRSLVFDFCFYVGTGVYITLFFPLLPWLSRRFVYNMYRDWTAWVFWMLKHIVGLSYRVEGRENLAEIQGSCLIACKHQSAWETLVFSQLLDDFTLVLKKELLSIPIYGKYHKKLGSIALDRSKGAASLKYLFKELKKRQPQGIPVLIFPEGSRKAPGERQESYQPGIGFLYKHLNMRVFPVAVNSGCFWKRRAWIKHPGEITIHILPPLEPGLPDFMSQLTQALEDASLKLVPQKKLL